MCTVSMVMDHYHDKWKLGGYVAPNTLPRITLFPTPPPTISKEEVEEFRKLLDRAREYDKRNNEPNCELEEKKERLRALAKELGVTLPPL